MSDVESRLQEIGLTLPEGVAPVATYVPYTIAGNLVHVSGQIPIVNGETLFVGRLGDSISIEEGKKAAQTCALNVLSQLKAAINADWSRVKQCIKIGGFVQCSNDFTDQSEVINGASDLMVTAFGEPVGQHARFAVGTNALPRGVCVEVEGIFEIG